MSYRLNSTKYCNEYKCCTTIIKEGPTGPPGESAIGKMGPTGEGYTGPTGRGCRGATGDPGPTGPPGPKSFIIQHPILNDNYLVHACLEGPEVGVYYRGVGEIKEENNLCTTIILPKYVSAFATDFTINVTPIFNGNFDNILSVSEIVNNEFTVYSKNNCKFYWTVTGRQIGFNFEIEPLKSSVTVKGDGPYLYI